jgi:putative transposase
VPCIMPGASSPVAANDLIEINSILCGEAALCHALKEYVEHYHHERNHQGKGNVLLFPAVRQDPEHEGPIWYRERLGGLLKYYEREAA